MKASFLGLLIGAPLAGVAVAQATAGPQIDGKLALEAIGLLVGSGTVGGGVGKYMAREAQRRADAALRLCDEEKLARHSLELVHQQTRTLLDVARDELSKVRIARHHEANAINGWRLQHEERMDELKDRLSEIAGELKARRT